MSQYGNYPITEEYKKQVYMHNLQKDVVQWAQDKGLLTHVTPERIEKQTLKVLEEIGETAGAYLKGNREELIDGIGDVAVTLIILGAMRGHEITILDFQRDNQTFLMSVVEATTFYSQDLDEHYLKMAYTHLDLFAKSQDLELGDCLQSAYNVIAKRTGKMVNGTFIKD